MEKISISLPSDQVRRLEELVEQSECDNRSDAARTIIEKGFEADELERTVERLQNEKRLILEQRDENTELVEYVEAERGLQRLERERRTASIWQRAKWLMFGRSDETTEV